MFFITEFLRPYRTNTRLQTPRYFVNFDFASLITAYPPKVGYRASGLAPYNANVKYLVLHPISVQKTIAIMDGSELVEIDEGDYDLVKNSTDTDERIIDTIRKNCKGMPTERDRLIYLNLARRSPTDLLLHTNITEKYSCNGLQRLISDIDIEIIVGPQAKSILTVAKEILSDILHKKTLIAEADEIEDIRRSKNSTPRYTTLSRFFSPPIYHNHPQEFAELKALFPSSFSLGLLDKYGSELTDTFDFTWKQLIDLETKYGFSRNKTDSNFMEFVKYGFIKPYHVATLLSKVGVEHISLLLSGPMFIALTQQAITVDEWLTLPSNDKLYSLVYDDGLELLEHKILTIARYLELERRHSKKELSQIFERTSEKFQKTIDNYKSNASEEVEPTNQHDQSCRRFSV